MRTKLVMMIGFITILLFGFTVNVRTAEARPMDYTKAVIHHTATRDVSIDSIRRHHINVNKWDDVGYHFLIRADGTIEEGRNVNIPGAHARSRNHYIGIALTGYDSFTTRQLDALVALLRQLGITHIERHHEECPGPGLDLNKIKDKL